MRSNKALAKALGQKKLNKLHLEKYSTSLKAIINEINQDSAKKQLLKKQTKSIAHIETNELGMSDTFGRELMHDLQKVPNKEKIKLKDQLHTDLATESQKYYQNNLNLFTNGLSLLSVSALETKNNLKVMQSQTREINEAAENIEAHSTYVVAQSFKLKQRLKKMEKAMV
jgi:hypothetical protein